MSPFTPIAFLAAVLCISSSVEAFPANFNPTDAGKGCPFAEARAANVSQPSKRGLAFDAAAQRIDITGKHAFIAPSPGDLRGPCPGLNAMANHGYINRGGLISILDAVEATGKVFGMGVDLATFLSTYAVVFDGDPLTLQWSIGGTPSGDVPSILLGAPGGLSGSHNKYENDASPARGDAYTHGGDASSVDINNFKSLYDQSPAPGDYNLDVLTKYRKVTFERSVSTNPYFFYGEFAGLLVSQAAHTFIPSFMTNRSSEHPEGLLTRDVLRAFYSIEEDGNGGLRYNKGHERIPENWYKRSLVDPYTIPRFLLDAVSVLVQVPEALAVGGNTGKVNSFTGVDIGKLTGGVYNTRNLLEGNNLFCFATQVVQQAPDFTPEFKDAFDVLALLGKNIAPLQKTLGCPALEKVDESEFAKFPGRGNAV